MWYDLSTTKNHNNLKGASPILQGYYSIMQTKKQAPDCEWKYISVTPQNSKIADVVKTSFVPACHIKRISKTLYMKGSYDRDKNFITDGEVFSVAEKGEPMRNRRSLKRIFKELRQLIAHNCEGGEKELFVTLTYAEQTNDHKRIHSDFKKFWGRLKYNYANSGLEYITVVEPHASGMFHIHMLLKATSSDRLYIPNEVMQKIWGHGFTKTERLEDIDHIGAYVIAYMTDMEIPPEFESEYAKYGDIVEKDGKKFIKGKRLDFYPDGMQISRHSRGMVRPEKLTGNTALREESLLKSVGIEKFSNVKELDMTDEEGKEHTAYVQTEQHKYDLPWD